MKTWAEIPSFSAAGLRAGTLRGSDLAAFDRVLAKLRKKRVVLVTGTGAAATAAAVGLATTATARGHLTALLECDLVEPGLARALGLALAPGLQEYLRGEAEASQILQTVVPAGPGTESASEPLVCIVAGAPPSDPAALSSPAFSHTVAKLRNGYELVVSLAPPLGRDTDALVAAAAHADATVACVADAVEARNLPVDVSGLLIQA